jgi:hypothetical protein
MSTEMLVIEYKISTSTKEPRHSLVENPIWEQLPVLFTVPIFYTDTRDLARQANTLAVRLLDSTKDATTVRWNWQGLAQGHYVHPANIGHYTSG